MSHNAITNVVGAIGAAAAAAGPVIDATNGALHGQDYLNLIMGVAFAVIAFFTGKSPKAV